MAYKIVTSLDYIGKAIRDVRRNKGITQEELANRLGKATSYISHIENGKRETSMKNLKQIWDMLGFDIWFSIQEREDELQEL